MRWQTAARMSYVLILLCARYVVAPAGEIVDGAKLQALAQPLVDGGWAVGLSIALINDKGTQVVGFGRVSDADSRVRKRA